MTFVMVPTRSFENRTRRHRNCHLWRAIIIVVLIMLGNGALSTPSLRKESEVGLGVVEAQIVCRETLTHVLDPAVLQQLIATIAVVGADLEVLSSLSIVEWESLFHIPTRSQASQLHKMFAGWEPGALAVADSESELLAMDNHHNLSKRLTDNGTNSSVDSNPLWDWARKEGVGVQYLNNLELSWFDVKVDPLLSSILSKSTDSNFDEQQDRDSLLPTGRHPHSTDSTKLSDADAKFRMLDMKRPAGPSPLVRRMKETLCVKYFNASTRILDHDINTDVTFGTAPMGKRRGIRATHPIKRGDNLLAIPWPLVINNGAAASQAMADVLIFAKERLVEWRDGTSQIQWRELETHLSPSSILLAVHLLMIAQDIDGSFRHFGMQLCNIVSESMGAEHLPAYWSAEKLQLVDAKFPGARSTTHSLLAATRMVYNTLFSTLSNRYPTIFSTVAITEDDFIWAVCLQMAYGFSMQGHSGDQLELWRRHGLDASAFLSPIAGMFNNEPRRRLKVGGDAKEESELTMWLAITEKLFDGQGSASVRPCTGKIDEVDCGVFHLLRAHRDFKVGEEVTIPYYSGEMEPHNVLVKWGYVPSS